MLRFIFLMLSLLCLLALKAFSQTPFPKDLMVGYATMNGGTTGGQGGTTVNVSTFSDFKSYAEEINTPYIILVSGEINSGDDKGASIRVESNKSIIGLGSNALLNGVGLLISGKKNIIIRNIAFTMTGITNTTDPAVYDPDGDEGRPQILTNGGDCIKIQSGATNIWIDHCEFYSIDPAVQTNQDLYDGLVDATGSSKYITISWCYFHDHHKCTLVGSSDSDNFDRLITFHHNYYYNIKSRTPSYRFGHGHMFNNYYSYVGSSGINTRMGACLRVEGNHFENSANPVTVSNAGKYEVSDNLYTNCTGSKPTISTCGYTIPYYYSTVFQTSDKVKDTVLAYAGPGIVSTQDYQGISVTITSPANGTSFPGSATITINANADAGNNTITKVQFYSGNNLLGEDDTDPYSFEWNNASSGTHTITAVAIHEEEQRATSVEKTITVNSTTSIIKGSTGIFSEIHPNPSNTLFTIQVKEKISSFSVFNSLGNQVKLFQNLLPGERIEFGSELNSGIYTVKVQTYSDEIEILKLIKTR